MAAEPEKPDACESCDFVTAEIAKYSMMRFFPAQPNRVKWLCELCASTMAGSAFEYPEQYPDKSGEILRAICYVGNSIIAEIRATKIQETSQ